MFELTYRTDSKAKSKVFLAPEGHKLNQVVLQLNLMQKPNITLSIPRLRDLYQPEKITPLFMLSLLQYLDDIDNKIPAPEKTGELRIVRQRLTQYATQVLLGGDLEIDTRLGTQDVGYTLIQGSFQKICTSLYPRYTTLISSASWEKYMAAYINALHNPKVNTSISRGKEPLDTTKDYITSMFGQKSKQTVQTHITERLSPLTRLEWGKGRSEDAKLWFVMHPLEEKILQLLRNSRYTEQRQEGTIHILPAMEIFEIGKELGYKQEEVAEIIKLLEARQYVTYDPKTNSIEQLIRSTIELVELLNEGLGKVETEIERLKVIADFDPQIYQPRIDKIKAAVSNVEKPEDVEEPNAKLRSIEYGLGKYITKKSEKLLAELRDAQRKVQPLLVAGVPDELTRAISGGQAPWSGVLEDSRQRLRKRYDELISQYKQFAQEIEKVLTELGPAEPEASYLVELVKAHTSFHEQAEYLYNQRAALSAYQSNLRAWRKLLQRSNRIHQDAVTAKASFDETEFLNAAEILWHQISEKFEDAPIDTLSDHVVFSKSITELEQNIGSWQRKRREDFMAEKTRLVDALRQIGDNRPILKTNFDPYIPPEENRENLRQEAAEHFHNLLTRLEQQYQQLRNEVIYAESVQQITSALSADSVNHSLKETHQLKDKANFQTLSEETDLEAFTKATVDLQDTFTEMSNTLRETIVVRPPESQSERDLLHTIQESATASTRGVELREVILNLIVGNPDFQLEQMIHDLQELFKKNQVIIRVQPRR